MQPADLDAVMAIEPVIYPYPWSRGNFSDSLAAGHSCWIAEQNRRIVGYAVLMLVLDEAHLLNISIAAGHQGQGLGRIALEDAMKVAAEWPADAIRLDAWDADAGAGAFYAKCGFNQRGRVIYRGTPLVYFERML